MDWKSGWSHIRLGKKSGSATLGIIVRERASDAEMKISGRVRECDVCIISEALRRYESRSVRRYVMDLGMVESISLAALEEILVVRERIERRGAAFEFADVSVVAEKMLRTLGAEASAQAQLCVAPLQPEAVII